jgi:hypothetical protein
MLAGFGKKKRSVNFHNSVRLQRHHHPRGAWQRAQARGKTRPTSPTRTSSSALVSQSALPAATLTRSALF